MGRSPCCDKMGLKKGPWTPEEDQKLLAYIEEHGHGNWRALPIKAGLQRCGKSCRLRWTNYLRPDIKRGKFTLQEEQTIIQLHALLGNRWSAIATHLPKRTDNEIKNYWNTHLKKRLTKMGIDPVTHKPRNDALHSAADGGQQSKNAANLSHMAQWESARLEAEARLVRQSKLRSNSSFSGNHLLQSDVLNFWQGGGLHRVGIGIESPTSTLSFSENGPPQVHNIGPGSIIEFMASNDNNNNNNDNLGLCDSFISTSSALNNDQDEDQDHDYDPNHNFMEGFTELLLSTTTTTTVEKSVLAEEGRDHERDNNGSNGGTSSTGSDDHYYEDNKNYWNSILNLVNSSPSPSPSPLF